MDETTNLRHHGYGVYNKLTAAATHQRRRCGTLNSGSAGLDALLGGGLTAGSIIELFGPPSSGKSTLALLATARAQQQGRISVIIDSEAAFDKTYAKALGVDLAALTVITPFSAENAFDAVMQLVTAEAADLIVIDSIAALAPNAELNTSLLAAEPGHNDTATTTADKHAAAIKRNMLLVRQACEKSATTIIMINQMRTRFARPYERADRNTTTGGNAVSDIANTRIETAIDHDNGILTITLLRNDFAPFKGTTRIRLHDGRPDFTRAYEVADLARRYNEIETDNDLRLYYRDNFIADNSDMLVEALSDNQALLDDIERNVITSIIKDMTLRAPSPLPFHL